MKNIKSSNGKVKIVYKEIRLKSEEIENDTPCKWKSKESWNSNTLSDNIDFNIKNITRVKEK